jgi:cation diffusion facilitator CzcD-associated flavoprotein CzcO
VVRVVSPGPGPAPGDARSHLDVLVVGAGLSGIAAAAHLQRELPSTTYAVLEAREASGGTWDLFRYPGIRSDSDMHTLGYAFRPWPDARAIADGPSILRYVRDTARELRIDERIRYRSRAVAAAWSSDAARWTVRVQDTADGSTSELTCGFLLLCTGYYRYDRGFTPEFPGLDRFRGQVVHPQAWPPDLDVTGRRVVVIGSGATAVTLVPALAARAAGVTMLQRTPTWIASRPTRDAVAERLRRVLPERTAFRAVRTKDILLTMASYSLSRRCPQLVKRLVGAGLRRQLPPGYDVATHFTPPYDPWDQRFCLVPDGDLFRAIRDGSAEVVTGHVEAFHETGLRLTDGRELPADVVVTATGLVLQAMGGITLTVDGREVVLSQTVAYKGAMFSGIPNLAAVLGYTNASWTLKCELVCAWVCRLLRHLEESGADTVVARWPEPELPDVPLVDLRSGYVLRDVGELPRQGRRAPWRVHQNYLRDRRLLGRGRSAFAGLHLSRWATPDGEPGSAGPGCAH